jgi:predicted nucleic acid-binding Zn ribbon protein
LRTRRPSAVSSVVAATLTRIRADKEVDKYISLKRWPDVVGESLAAVTHPEKIVRNVLYVKVPDNVWVQELSLRKGEILKRLFDQKFGPPLDDIVFLPGDPLQFK